MNQPARWFLPVPPPSEAGHLAEALSVAPAVARVLWNRGYRDSAAARRFLDPALEDLLDPFLLKDAARAAERLARAVAARERILLYGDFDVDGSMSVVILKKAIELAGGRADFHVPDRFGEGYGMRPEVIEQAVTGDTSLIISVDTGIRACEAVRRAAELGVDVIITDHHLPEEALPPAFAIVNPNQPGCSYGEKNLCGAGVAFKLIQALMRVLGWPPAKQNRLAGSLLKLVAIATVADVVPLTGENRVIVKHGLSGLRTVRNHGLRALLDTAGIAEGERPTAGQVAFRVAPRMNAAGRMAHASQVIELFLTGDAGRAREIAAALQALNQERQQTEAAVIGEIFEQCAGAPVTAAQPALVFAGEGWHRGVIGIVATRLVESFHRPVFVMSVDPVSGEARGSGRSVPAFHLLEALESMPELFSRFGGHRQAAGITLPAGRIGEFRERLEGYAARRLAPDDFRPRLDVDAVVAFDELTDSAAAGMLELEPFGLGNRRPVLASLAAEVAGAPSVFKERHLRVPFRRDGLTFWLKAWNFAARADELLPGVRLDIAFAIEDDAYSAARGRPGWGLVLEDCRPASPAQ